ncbi:MAG: polysaccharide biosynthesis/export family protein [Pirellulaceae bacterium]|nr:polysaccharide biosynthesis/export family protein [Pirellulaceae bacterium]
MLSTPPNCDARMLECLPRELDKVTVPTYRIEPPDVLTIDVVQQVAQSTYQLQIGDVLAITVMGAFPEEPIAGDYQIEAGGVVALGYGYGSVEIAGNTVGQAKLLIEQHLLEQLRDPQVSLSLRDVAQFQPISGEHMVGSDGTISLGQYGSVPLVGLTLDEARMAIADHLSPYFANPQVSVSVYAFNSKVYYIVTQGGGTGDGLVRLPFTGNETVMDALSQINGLSYVSSSRMWIARPQHDGQGSQILPIDWEGITQRAEVRSNYQILPGDRIFIAHNSLVAFDETIAKLTSPFERIFGFTLLGTGTVSRLSGKVLNNNKQVVLFSPN